ncbi:class I adenylate-forming enzyme family protein [Kitasatospora sp. NPDC096204]|uniref:class I adenylate-forming enzyme family protein n=1 Tax=Kitasatospora sp. NPDC096204 TaxID=3364094 RepID=UPI0037FA1519
MSSGLLDDPRLGAGNLFRLAAAATRGAAQSRIELDVPYLTLGGERVHRFTLNALDELTDRVAAGFHHDGIRAKDPVAVFLGESVRYLIHYIALTKLGAIPVFLNSSLDPETARAFIQRVGAVAVVSDPERLAKDALDLPYYEADPYSPDQVTYFRHTENDPVLIAHTSGTTGVPKAVQFNHYGFFFGIRQQADADLGERILSVLPQSHASAISVLMSGVLRGLDVMLATERSPKRLVERFAAFRPQLVVGFPKVFVDLCRLDLDPADFASISYWMCTGDANHEQHIRKLVALGNHTDRSGRQQPGSLFIDNFGSSEFGFAMFRQVHTPTSDRYGRCIGRPFAWIDAQVFDDQDEPLGPFTVGRLGLKSPTVTAGYWNNSLLSEKNRVRGYWLTGDFAFRDEDGRFYHVDRTTDAITTSRGTVYSTQTEELILRNFPGLQDCSLVKSEDTGELVLAVELADPAADLDGLLTRINETLTAAALLPADRILTKGSEEFTGVTGKALKRAMRRTYAADGAHGQP